MNKVIKDVLDTKELTDLKEVIVIQEVVIPTMTTAKVETAVGLLKNVEENNGYNNIAVETELSLEQIKEIHLAMFERISELQPIKSKSRE